MIIACRSCCCFAFPNNPPVPPPPPLTHTHAPSLYFQRCFISWHARAQVSYRCSVASPRRRAICQLLISSHLCIAAALKGSRVDAKPGRRKNLQRTQADLHNPPRSSATSQTRRESHQSFTFVSPTTTLQVFSEVSTFWNKTFSRRTPRPPPQHHGTVAGAVSEMGLDKQTNTRAHCVSGHQWLRSKFPFKGSPPDTLWRT